MKIIEIKSKKQENELWGMPLNCFKIDKWYFNNNELLLSALLIAIDEKFNRKFEIFDSTDKGFIINLLTRDYNNTTSRMFGFKYSNYEVIDNKLYEFDNDQEHMSFLRKEKIKQLEII